MLLMYSFQIGIDAKLTYCLISSKMSTDNRIGVLAQLAKRVIAAYEDGWQNSQPSNDYLV